MNIIKILGVISITSFVFLSSGALYAMEETQSEEHMVEAGEKKAEDMDMEKSVHETVKTKAHMKYQAALKKAESTYKRALSTAVKNKNPKKSMMQAKNAFDKTKKDAEMMYQKEKEMGMKGASVKKK